MKTQALNPTRRDVVTERMLDVILEGFRRDVSVSYTACPRLQGGLAEAGGQTVVAALNGAILPLVAGLIERLEAGIAVLDVGCGNGRILRAMAKSFPNSRFTGYDLSAEAIAGAKMEADRRGLDNVQFAVQDLATVNEPACYDLITTFGVIYDQPEAMAALRNIARALRPGGIFLMQDSAASGHLYNDISKAGFTRVEVHRLPHDIHTNYYLARKRYQPIQVDAA